MEFFGFIIFCVIAYFVGRTIYRNYKANKEKTNSNISFEQERINIVSSIPDGMGALISDSRTAGNVIVGYYKGGVVYTNKLLPIGRYKKTEISNPYSYYSIEFNDMNFDNEEYFKCIGSYNKGRINHGYEHVATIYEESGYEYIHAENDSDTHIISISFTDKNDVAGAAAAYVILRFGWGSHFEETRKCFED